MVNYTDWFSTIKPTLHSWAKPYFGHITLSFPYTAGLDLLKLCTEILLYSRRILVFRCLSLRCLCLVLVSGRCRPQRMSWEVFPLFNFLEECGWNRQSFFLQRLVELPSKATVPAVGTILCPVNTRHRFSLNPLNFMFAWTWSAPCLLALSWICAREPGGGGRLQLSVHLFSCSDLQTPLSLWALIPHPLSSDSLFSSAWVSPVPWPENT